MGRISGRLTPCFSHLLWMLFFYGSQVIAEDSSIEADLDVLKKIRVEDKTDIAIKKGLAWLVAQQDPAAGNFGSKFPHAYTAFSCMALLAAGEQPARSKYGQALQKGILYLVEKAESNRGYLGGDGSRMYGHAIASLVLCEAYGMLDSPRANRRLAKAIDGALNVTIQAQVRGRGQHQGGWRYEPTSQDADLSVTAWQIFLLRAAQNCGFAVPGHVKRSALNYVRRLYNGAGFCYQKGREPTPAMQAAGIMCLKILEPDLTEADRAKIDTVAKSLEKVDPSQGFRYYYRSYYLATANNMLGGNYRSVFVPKLEKSLIRLQGDDGQFAKHGGYDGGIYSTALAVVSLSVRYQYLPIYQD